MTHIDKHPVRHALAYAAVLTVALATASLALAATAAPVAPVQAAAKAQAPQAPALQVRGVTPLERYELARHVVTRFGQPEPAEMNVSAAGPFRFANGPDFIYLERSDTGSVGFESALYGVRTAALDAASSERGAVLQGVEQALQRAGVTAEGRLFDSFQDEYDGAAQPDALPLNFDSRQASRHVARTAVYAREIGGVPVFGSELMVGLMPDGSIGRFRLHWPAIDAAMAQQAALLQQQLQAQRWAAPAPGEGVQVLERRAGIAHTGFGDPGYEARAVVRVLERRSSNSEGLALSSTGYRYYDADGHEVTIGRLPETPGTPAALKGQRAGR